MKERVYKYKLDYYWNSLLLYTSTLLVYLLIRGRFFQERFEIVIQDPILYIISAFVVFMTILLIINWIRGRELIFDGATIRLKNRFGEKSVKYSDIIAVIFSKENIYRKRQDKSRVRVAKLRVKNRKRFLRIRLSDFQNEKELMQEFKNLNKLGTSPA